MAQTKAISSARSIWIGAQSWALRRLASFSRTPRHAAHLETGSAGEREALFHLRRNGYTIVARRWRTARLRGDIDLVAWRGATLCIVEVKTRTRRDAVPAEMAVDLDKQRTLRLLARAYLRRLPDPARQANVRFDVISVYLESPSQDTGPHFELNQGAFGWA
jgi:putative endonuclease